MVSLQFYPNATSDGSTSLTFTMEPPSINPCFNDDIIFDDFLLVCYSGRRGWIVEIGCRRDRPIIMVESINAFPIVVAQNLPVFNLVPWSIGPLMRDVLVC